MMRKIYHMKALSLLQYGRNRIRSLLSEGDHWMRVVMNRNINEFISVIKPSNLNALEISGNE